MGLDRGGFDENLFESEVGEPGFVHVVFVVEGDGDLVDDLVAPAFADRRFHQLGLVAVDVVVGQDLPDGSDAGCDGGFVVGGGVLTEQVLQHVGGHDGVALDRLDEVLANDHPGEVFVDLAVQRRLHGCCDRGRIVGGDLVDVVDFTHH